MKLLKPFSLLILLFLISQIQVLPQKKNFTIEDVILGSVSNLTSGELKQLKWLPNNYEFSYLESNQDDILLIKEHIKSKMRSTVISLNELNRRLSNLQINFNNNFPTYEWINDSILRLQKGTDFYLIDTKTLELINQINLSKDAKNVNISPDGNKFAYTKSNNLFVYSDGKEIQVTSETNPDILNGQSVHRNEFGIDKGIFWSPNSKSIAFYRMDESMVTDYPIVNISERPAKVNLIKYPMAGMTSHEVTIGIFDINSEKTIWLKTGNPKDQYLTSLTWDPSEKYFYVGILNRDQNHLKMKKYDVFSGEELQILFDEKDEKYVEPEHPLFFIPNSNEFLWLSERNGFKHLYKYSTEGELLEQITKGDFPIIEFLGFDSKDENCFFVSNKDGIMNKYLYKLNMRSKEITKLNNDDGNNSAILNDDKSFFLNKYKAIGIPNIYSINDANGNEIRIIKKFENPLENYSLGKTEFKILKSNDGNDLYTRIIYPTEFDDMKIYPVIVSVYGGPHSQGVTNDFISGRYDFWFHYMAQRGYIIFELDNRGTDNRGINFEQATFRNLGTIEIEDQMVGVKYLKSLPFVDSTRFGVYGWSYGGFMATSLMLRTNSFKVGVAGGAVIDWSYYEIMYGERYMDSPQTNADGYNKSNLLNYVENLKDKNLLMVHGTEDPTVVWQHSLLFAEKATKLNQSLDYFPYPSYGHHVRGKDQVSLYTRIANYFLENL